MESPELTEIHIALKNPLKSWKIARMTVLVEGEDAREKISAFKQHVESTDFPFSKAFWAAANRESVKPRPVYVFAGPRPYELLLKTKFLSPEVIRDYLIKFFWPRLNAESPGRYFDTEIGDLAGGTALVKSHRWISHIVGAHIDLAPPNHCICFVPTGITPWVMTGELGNLKYFPLPLDELLGHEWAHLVCPSSSKFISLSKLPYHSPNLAKKYGLPTATLFLSETTYDGTDHNDAQHEAKTVAFVNQHYRLPLTEQADDHRYQRTIYNHLVADDVDTSDPQQLSLALIDSFVHDLPGEDRQTQDFLPTRNQGNGVFFIRPNGTVGRLSDARTRQYHHRWDGDKSQFVAVNPDDAQVNFLQVLAGLSLVVLAMAAVVLGNF